MAHNWEVTYGEKVKTWDLKHKHIGYKSKVPTKRICRNCNKSQTSIGSHWEPLVGRCEGDIHAT